VKTGKNVSEDLFLEIIRADSSSPPNCFALLRLCRWQLDSKTKRREGLFAVSWSRYLDK